MTPKELALELKQDARKIRRILRKLNGTLAIQGRTRRWELTETEIFAVIKAITTPAEIDAVAKVLETESKAETKIETKK